MNSVVRADNSTPSTTIAITRSVGGASSDRPTSLTTRGRTKMNRHAMNPAVRAATDSAPALLAWATPLTNASRHHAVTSSAAAHVNATAPNSVLASPRSARMRASTGKAVTDNATPMNRAKLVNDTSLVDNRGYRYSASVDPRRKGTTMLAC